MHRIIIIGKAASGKDHMRKILEQKKMKYAVTYTTRPKRNDETEGRDYHFISVEDFKLRALHSQFYEYVTFNEWYYGTTKKQFYEDDVFIMTPSGLSKVFPADRAESLVIFLDVPYDVRRERLSVRNDADTVDRRLEADEKDFSDFEDFDIRITDPFF